MDVGFIPIKSKILPQYDNSIPQTENIVKAQTFAVSENSKKSNATNAVASTAGVKILSPSSGKRFLLVILPFLVFQQIMKNPIALFR